MNLKTIGWPIMLASSILVLGLTYVGALPKNLMGAYALMFVLGIILGEIGSRVKFIDNWLGGGAILCIFVPAVLLHFGLMPEGTVGMFDDFMNKTPAFFSFFIGTMICGALLSISRSIVIKSTVKFLPTMVASVVFAWLFCWVGGVVTGYGGIKAVMMIGVPIMGGGVGAGALPLSQIYAEAAGVEALTPKDILSAIMPAVVVSNVISIIGGGLSDRLGKRYPAMTGNGNIMIVHDQELVDAIENEKKERDGAVLSIQNLGLGFFMSIMLYILAHAFAKYIPLNFHLFVWLILMLTVIKAVKLLPGNVELATIQWSNVWVRNLLYPALIPIGITFISVPEIIATFTNPSYMFISLLGVLGAVFGSAVIGRLCGLYPIEAGLAGGFCMANMGQTGDLAVLAAAKRMELLPYAAFATRIGGSIVLIVAGIMAAVLGIGM